MSRKKKPPQSADELLERYRAGERKFFNASLCHADLSDANLSRADLSDADLTGADLTGTDFTLANLTGADLSRANLMGANLNCTDLSRADLTMADLTEANVAGVSLSGAGLGGTDFLGADLTGVDLSGAMLSMANLTGSNLSNADLTRVNLVGTVMTGANLTSAKLGGACLGSTLLLNVDLSAMCDAEPPIQHQSPSSVDFKTIVKSLRSPRLKDFLHHIGMPEVFVEYMIDCARTLEPLGIFKLLQSTFISYGVPDELFARRLYEALHKDGVTTFFFPEHAVPGKKLGRMIRQGVNDFDRIILVCTKDSLDQKRVLTEVEHSLDREAREGGTELIIPVLLDDYLFSGWSPPHPDVLLTLKDRVVADFRGWDTDPAKFDHGLRKLIMALKK